MTRAEFDASTTLDKPPEGISVPLAALWWDAKGDWTRAHELVDELETPEGMAVHAYLHRKGGDASNAEYWYKRAGRVPSKVSLEAEWEDLVGEMISGG
jgi:hypothetical protein